MRHIHDRALLDALEQMGGHSLEFEVWRVAWKTRDVLDVGAGGRWNPPGRIEALYTSLEPDGAIAEVYHQLSRAPVFSSAEKLLYRLKVRTRSTLKLENDEELSALVEIAEASAVNDLSAAQAIGAAAHLLEHDSLLVPSARWNCSNLLVFVDLLSNEEIQIVGKPRSINWPAWREAHEAEFARIRRAGRSS